jgi:hypothetical protein
MVYVAEGLASIGQRVGKWYRRDKGVDLTDISRDVGCKDVSLSCLTCPLPACLFDIQPAGRAEFLARFLQQTGQ